METDLAYYARRVREEHSLAEQAEKPEARSAHRPLATIYTERVEALSSGKPDVPDSPPAFQWERAEPAGTTLGRRG